MNELELAIHKFQTFYVSKEESNSPFVVDIVRIGKKIKENSLLKDMDVSISLKYGKRVLMNAKNSNVRKIDRKGLLELVDYDPMKKVLLAIGPNEARVESPIHWFIHHSRDEVNAAIQINDKELAEKYSKNLTVTKKDWPIGTFESIKEVLKALRNNKKIVIKNQGLLFVGENIADLEDDLLKTLVK